jgi:hypothetical protein
MTKAVKAQTELRDLIVREEFAELAWLKAKADLLVCRIRQRPPSAQVRAMFQRASEAAAARFPRHD